MIKKIFILFIVTVILAVANSFAETKENIQIKLDTKEKVESIIKTSDTKNYEDIIKMFENTITYDDGEYTGKLELDISNIKIQEVNTGYKEHFITEDKIYDNCNDNDLFDIPKEISKDGIKLILVKTDWIIKATNKIAGSDVPVSYIAVAHYKGIKKANNPPKYEITAIYKGEVIKETKEIVTVEIPEDIKTEEKQSNNLISIIATTTAISSGIFIAFIFWKRRKKSNKE